MSYNLGHVVGAAGKGISSIVKTGTSGLVDTYTITYTDGTTQTYEVTNGQDGAGGADIVTSWESTLSDEKIPSEKLTKNTIDGKADTNHSHGSIDKDGKIGSTSGKPVITGTGGLVTTGAFGTSSGQFAEGNHSHSGYVSGTKVTSWSGTVSNSNIPSEKLTKDTLDTKITGTKVTSWSGTVSDSNIPSEKLTKDSLDTKVTGSKVTSWSSTLSDSNIPSEKLVKNAIDMKVTGARVTAWSGTVTDTNVPSEKLVKNSLDAKQATLVSGTNIKTINNNSILGSGNIDIQGGGGSNVGSFTDLQDLIDDASSGDVIILDKDYKNAGGESVIGIDKPLTILGNGHVIDADKQSRIFTISSGVDGCKFYNIIFTNGKDSVDNGSAIGQCTTPTSHPCTSYFHIYSILNQFLRWESRYES